MNPCIVTLLKLYIGFNGTFKQVLYGNYKFFT